MEAFSFFTKRTEYTSLRLRVVARGLQVWGILTGITLAASTYYQVKSGRFGLAENVVTVLVGKQIVWSIGQCLSYYFIGRAMLRRERWGAYVALLIIAVPAILNTFYFRQHGIPLPFAMQVLPIISLTLIGSVWKELGSVRDSDLALHGRPPEPTIPLTPRNRGYGETRGLPLGNIPTTTMIAAKTPLPIRNPRDS